MYTDFKSWFVYFKCMYYWMTSKRFDKNRQTIKGDTKKFAIKETREKKANREKTLNINDTETHIEREREREKWTS